MPSLSSTNQSIAAMLQPASIAVVGATERLQYGGRFLDSLIRLGFRGRLYPINPHRATVFGIPCLPSISALPEPVDLAAIIIPASGVLAALQECAQKGVKSAVVIAAGFAELGDEAGRQLQKDVRRLARETGVRVCGPNCLGLANVAESVWACSIGGVAGDVVVPPGPIGVICQSGATAFGPLMAVATDRGAGFRYVVSTGNEADLEVSDFIAFMLEDPEVKAMALLVEGIRDGAQFLAVAERALEAGKPLVVLKLGRSAVGARAAMTHTAALVGSDEVHSAAFRQKGVLRVDDYDELVEITNMFARAHLPGGERVGLVSHSGGIGGLMGDKCGELGLPIPQLEERTIEKLATILEGRGAAANPADITGHAHRETFSDILGAMLEDENVDLLGVGTAGGEDVAQRVIDAARSTDKPVLLMWTGRLQGGDGLAALRTSPVPVFHRPGTLARGIRALIDYQRARRRYLAAREGTAREAAAGPLGESALRLALGDRLPGRSGSPLTEHESKEILSLAGIATTREVLCRNLDEGTTAAREIGYPVALKVVSPDIPHKTEAGAVRLGVKDERELSAAWEQVLSNALACVPSAHLEGVLVQEMVGAGVEVIVGVSRDPQFGAVLLFGLGGVCVEALGAVSRRLCPVSAAEAREMIAEVKGMDALLSGYRGRPPADVDALVEALCRVSAMAVAAGDLIGGIDINPLAVLPRGQGVKALDALVVPGKTGALAGV